jgi:hypothetical protein
MLTPGTVYPNVGVPIVAGFAVTTALEPAVPASGTSKSSDVELSGRICGARMPPTVTVVDEVNGPWPVALRVTIVPFGPLLGDRVTGPGTTAVYWNPGRPIVAGTWVATGVSPAVGHGGVVNVRLVPSYPIVVGARVSPQIDTVVAML